MTRDVFIGLGSNLGDRLAHLADALRRLAALEGTHVEAVSNVVESEPWGVTDQPRFANAVARVSTTLRADQLLAALKDIEAGLGRTPAARYGPRVIDLDLLLFGDEEWAGPDLTVPHPRMAERDFVVTPLLEIAPLATYPDGSPVTRERATLGPVVGVLGPVPGFESVTPPAGGLTARQPVEGWEVVAAAYLTGGRYVANAPDLLFDAAVLEQAGIEVAWDPVRPGEESLPWPLPRTFRLLVPAAQADHARAVLADAHASGAAFIEAPPVPGGRHDSGGGQQADGEAADER